GGRFYDAKFGIFLSPDPIGPLNGGSTFGNRYSYVGYDPINYRDPTGFQGTPPPGPPPPPGAEPVDCSSQPNRPECNGGEGLPGILTLIGAAAVGAGYGISEGCKEYCDDIGKAAVDLANAIADIFRSSPTGPAIAAPGAPPQMFGPATPAGA